MAPLINIDDYSKKVGSKVRSRSKLWENSKDVDELINQNERNGKFKHLVREGIPDDLRCVIWTKILKLGDLPDYERDFAKAKETFTATKLRSPKDPQTYTAFGGVFNAEKFALTTEGQLTVQTILEIIGNEFPNLEYCAYLPSIVALLTHHFAPDDVLGAVRVLVRKSLDHRDWGFFPVNVADTMMFHSAFTELLKQIAPKIYKHIKNFGEFSPLWIRWLDCFLLDVISLPTAFRLLDTFLVEGYKVIYRYCAAVLVMKSAEILKCKDVAEVDKLFENNLVGEIHEDEDKLSKLAFSMSFSRETINKIVKNGKESFSTHTTTSSIEIDNRKYLPKVYGKSSFLTQLQWEYMWTWIPRRYKTLDVEILFSTDMNGYNLSTLYQTCAFKEPQMLFVETLTGEVFGAYISDSWDGKTGGNKFFGTAETFLFVLTENKERKYEWVGLNLLPDQSDRLKEVNENASLFIFGNYQYMAIGGGGLHYGLSLDERLSKGTTGKCKTFDNEPLNGKSAGTFEVKNVEVWCFK